MNFVIDGVYQLIPIKQRLWFLQKMAKSRKIAINLLLDKHI